jgi:hypothetical protein
MLRIVKCVSATDFSAGSTAVDGKPNQNHERDNPEQYQRSDDLIAGEAHRLTLPAKLFALILRA